MIHMRSRIGLGVLVVAGAAVAFAAPALADDAHIPNPSTGYCPGGSMGSPIYMGFCDGERYPDGTYWHTRQWGIPLYSNNNGLLGTNGGGPAGAECVIDNGSPLPPPAPPGGCGGAVPAPPPDAPQA